MSLNPHNATTSNHEHVVVNCHRGSSKMPGYQPPLQGW